MVFHFNTTLFPLPFVLQYSNIYVYIIYLFYAFCLSTEFASTFWTRNILSSMSAQTWDAFTRLFNSIETMSPVQSCWIYSKWRQRNQFRLWKLANRENHFMLPRTTVSNKSIWPCVTDDTIAVSVVWRIRTVAGTRIPMFVDHTNWDYFRYIYINHNHIYIS